MVPLAFGEIQTDKDTYMMKDTVIVTGFAEIPHRESLILVEIIDSNENRIGEESLTDDEDFTEGFLVDPDTWSVGEYTARITLVEDEYFIDSNGQSERTGDLIRLGDFEETVSFQVIKFSMNCPEGLIEKNNDCYKPHEPVNPSQNADPKDQRIEELELRVQILEDEKFNLEKENSRLNEIIDTLRNEAERMTNEFYNTILNQMEWFQSR